MRLSTQSPALQKNSHVLAASIAGVCLLILLSARPALAQGFSVLHAFTGGQDGGNPAAGLIIDRAGNLYGTGTYGGDGQGTIFKVSQRGSGWIFTPLHVLAGEDGSSPLGLTSGPGGALYGTTLYGGAGGSCGGMGCGTVFKLTPPPNACGSVLCPWTYTVLYRFTGLADGGFPHSRVTFDRAGNLYGTALRGGALNQCPTGCGVVFELSPSSGSWTETVLYSFANNGDGYAPEGGLVFDALGSLYGTTTQGGLYGYGNAFQLTPSGSGWTRTTLHDFGGYNRSDGDGAVGDLIFDAAGNLYGVTNDGGPGGAGTVFELSPSAGGWTETLLYSFASPDGLPEAGLLMDAAGNLYGTVAGQGGDYGSVFRLTPSSGTWIYTSLYHFTNGSDGARPESIPIMDAHGNLFGTASGGGLLDCVNGSSCGTVWEITP